MVHIRQRKISPVIGFIQPSTARDILVTRQPGKVGRDRIMIRYIVAPPGYDPRNPFIRGAEIGHVIFQVIAVDGEPKNGPDTAAKGRIVSKIGQEWYKKVVSASYEYASFLFLIYYFLIRDSI
uniref:MSP domain-containing protein n=1 Tax=Ascaris lumbricoides TaxID=6252 RepID=A0A0M3ICG7_ASCLU